MGLVALAVCVLLVPVKNAADKGGDEGDLGFSTSHSLGEGEEQRHVAVDPILLLQLPVQRTHTQSSGYQRKKKQDTHIQLKGSKTICFLEHEIKSARQRRQMCISK